MLTGSVRVDSRGDWAAWVGADAWVGAEARVDEVGRVGGGRVGRASLPVNARTLPSAWTPATAR